ncbi:PepSY domain-containing protein [Candidatus Saccharibacteria bacterium]|nr:PepSY domain-containing protein [Candidatus Saccharibacteria bacterium]
MPSKNKLILALLSLALAVIAIICAATAFFYPLAAKISADEARQIAIEHIGGDRANPPEIKLANWRRVWSVEVFQNGFIHEVRVSTHTGDIIE